jgi:hypothetical protein
MTLHKFQALIMNIIGLTQNMKQLELQIYNI